MSLHLYYAPPAAPAYWEYRTIVTFAYTSGVLTFFIQHILKILHRYHLKLITYSYFSDENIWKKFKRKFNAKNEVSIHRHYDNYYGRKFSIELQEHQSPSTLKLDANTFRKPDGKHNFHADAVLANWNSPP